MGSIDKSYGCRWKEYKGCRVCVGKFGMGCGVWTYKLWLNYLQGRSISNSLSKTYYPVSYTYTFPQAVSPGDRRFTPLLTAYS